MPIPNNNDVLVKSSDVAINGPHKMVGSNFSLVANIGNVEPNSLDKNTANHKAIDEPNAIYIA